MNRRNRRTAAACLLGVLAALGGCARNNTYVPPPPPMVKIGRPVQRTITLYHYYTGTTQASELVQIRARVQGYLESIHFADGTDVRAGQLLFVIDPRPYEAQLAQAKANLESKRAAARRAESVYRRTLSLVPLRAETQQDVDVQRGDWLIAKAAILQAEAQVREAELNVGYTRIRAPISGRIGRHLADVGSLVSADNTVLAVLSRYDPMFAYFTVSEQNFLGYLKRQRERPPGTLEAESPSPPTALAAALGLAVIPPVGPLLAAAAARLAMPNYPLDMALANETGYPHRGYIDFADNTVDPNTGTLQLRATFVNPPPYYLAPGLFVRLRVPIGRREHALLVPQRALGTDQAGRFLLVVNNENVVERRDVEVGPEEGDMQVIEKGISPEERFVVEGLQQARPGSKVQPMTKEQ